MNTNQETSPANRQLAPDSTMSSDNGDFGLRRAPRSTSPGLGPTEDTEGLSVTADSPSTYHLEQRVEPNNAAEVLRVPPSRQRRRASSRSHQTSSMWGCDGFYVSRGMAGLLLSAALIGVNAAGVVLTVGNTVQQAITVPTTVPDCTKTTELSIWGLTITTCVTYHNAQGVRQLSPQCYIEEHGSPSEIAILCGSTASTIIVCQAFVVACIGFAFAVGIGSFLEQRLPASGPRRIRMVAEDGSPIPDLLVVATADDRAVDEQELLSQSRCSRLCIRGLNAPCSSVQHIIAHPVVLASLCFVVACLSAASAALMAGTWSANACALKNPSDTVTPSAAMFADLCDTAFLSVSENASSSASSTIVPYAETLTTYGSTLFCSIASSCVAFAACIIILVTPASTRLGERLDAPRSGAVVGRPVDQGEAEVAEREMLQRRDLNPAAATARSRANRGRETRRCFMCRTLVPTRFPLLRCSAQTASRIPKDATLTPLSEALEAPQVPSHAVCGHCVDAQVYVALNMASVGQDIQCPFERCHGSWIFNIYSSFLKPVTLHRALIMFQARQRIRSRSSSSSSSGHTNPDAPNPLPRHPSSTSTDFMTEALPGVVDRSSAS